MVCRELSNASSFLNFGFVQPQNVYDVPMWSTDLAMRDKLPLYISKPEEEYERFQELQSWRVNRAFYEKVSFEN